MPGGQNIVARSQSRTSVDPPEGAGSSSDAAAGPVLRRTRVAGHQGDESSGDLENAFDMFGSRGVAPETPIATPEGYRMAADLRPGSLIMARDGRCYPVVSAATFAHPAAHLYRLSFASHPPIESGAEQSWIVYDGAGRARLRDAPASELSAWRNTSITELTAVRRSRARMDPRAEATMGELLRMSRQAGLRRWRDIEEFRSVFTGRLQPVCGRAANDPGSIWSVPEAWRLLEQRVASDADAPFGRTLTTAELADIATLDLLSIPLAARLVLDPVRLPKPPGPTGVACVARGAHIPVAYLRGSHAQRTALWRGMKAAARAAGLEAGVIDVCDAHQESSLRELLTSLGVPHSIARMTDPRSPGPGRRPVYSRISFPDEDPGVPGSPSSLGFARLLDVQAVKGTELTYLSVGSPDGTFLMRGLLAAYSR